MPLTFTHEGGPALTPGEQGEFLALALNWLPGPTFYEGEKGRRRRYQALLSALLLHDPGCVADLAAYSRQVLGLRTVRAHLEGLLPGRLLKYQGVAATPFSRPFAQRDALRLFRLRLRSRAQAAVFRQLLGKATPEDRVLSQKGNTREAWREVLPHLGALALVRNLRNLLTAGFTFQDLLPHAERVDVRYLYPHQLHRAYEE